MSIQQFGIINEQLRTQRGDLNNLSQVISNLRLSHSDLDRKVTLVSSQVGSATPATPATPATITWPLTAGGNLNMNSNSIINASNITTTDLTVTGNITAPNLNFSPTNLTLPGYLTVTGNLTANGPVNTINNLIDPGISNLATVNAQTLVLSSTTNSFATTTGALVVAGGVGINKDVHIGGSIFTDTIISQNGTVHIDNNSNVEITSQTTASNTTTGALVVTGGLGIGGEIHSGGDIHVGGEIVTDQISSANSEITIVARANIDDTSNSTASNNGALHVRGGVGIEKDVYIGGSLNVTNDTTLIGALNISNATPATDKSSGALIIAGGVGINKDVHIGGNLWTDQISSSNGTINIDNTTVSISSTEQAINTSSGALVVTGGLGVGGNLHADNIYSTNVFTDIIQSSNNTVQFTNTTTASDTGTGAVTVSGGVGIGGDLFVGGGTTVEALTVSAASVHQGAVTIHGPVTHNNVTDFTNPAQSTSPSSGAVVVTGGVGVGKNLNVSGTLSVTDTTTLTETKVDGVLFYNQGTSIYSNFYENLNQTYGFGPELGRLLFALDTVGLTGWVSLKQNDIPQGYYSYQGTGTFVTSTSITNGYLHLRNQDLVSKDYLISMYTSSVSDVWDIQFINGPNALGIVMNVDNVISCTNTLTNSTLVNNNNLMTMSNYSIPFTLGAEIMALSSSETSACFMFDIVDQHNGYDFEFLEFSDQLASCIKSSTSHLIDNTNFLTPNVWYNINMTYNGTNLSVGYVEADSVQAAVTLNTPLSNTNAGRLGILANKNIKIRKLNIQY